MDTPFLTHYGSPGIKASATVSDVASQVTTSSSKPTSHDHTNNLHTVIAIVTVHTVIAIIARRREMPKSKSQKSKAKHKPNNYFTTECADPAQLLISGIKARRSVLHSPPKAKTKAYKLD
jgi:hypothetical protein